MDNKQIRVLVIDDTEANRYILRRHLESANYVVHEAATGKEGLSLAEKLLPEIIILDVGLPDINGYEVCKMIKKQPWGAYLHIIQLSAAFVKDQDKILGLESGSDSYLVHPIEPKFLLAQINAVARTQAAETKLRNTTKALEQTEAELQVALKMRDEFISIASHELRTPLTTLSLQIQILLKYFNSSKFNEIPQDKILKAVHASEKQINNLSKLIGTLFDVTLMGSGKLRLHCQHMDLLECVKEVLCNMAPAIAQAGCEVHLLTKQANIHGEWDRMRIMQIIYNLLSNAVKYAPKKPIDIILEAQEFNVSLIIQDHGPGIEPENQEKIFERFVCLNNKTAVCGLGLGLYIVRQIVDAHGGHISLTSSPKMGAAFKIKLPL